MDNERTVKFEDELPVSDAFYDYTDTLRNSAVPLVIDNGSYKCRAGWACDDSPRLVFKNIIAKPKAKKSAMDTDVLIGNDISSLDAARWQIKSPFERNIVTQFDAQEQILDYCFSHLGINTDGGVEHPVVLSEPVCNPTYCREKMSELLFECYRVPRVVYGIDALFSLYHNHHDPNNPRDLDALVLSCGYHTTHVLPVLNGRLQAEACRRINIGGSDLDGFMLRVLQLKYPQHQAVLTLSRAEELVQKHCHMAVDFESELMRWTDDGFYADHVYKIQLPYNQQAAASLSAEQQKGRREQQVRRLREINIKRCQRKLVLEQDRLQKLVMAYEMIQETDDDIDDEIVMRALREVGLTTVENLKDDIDKLTLSVQRLQEKLAVNEDGDGVKPTEQTEAVDEQLKKDEQLQRRQRTMKRPKAEKKLDVDKVPAENDKPAMDAWIASLHQQRQEILSGQLERKQRRTEMTKRRTHASQHRMKILTELAQSSKRKKEDTFGMNDEDWNVYKQINTEGGDTDSEDEADRLEEVESYLRVYDPQFKSPNQQDTVFDIAEYYRLHIALEQIRTPELLYQPSMLGLEQAGIDETIQFVLSKFSPDDQQRLVQNVFVTGGCTSLPNFTDRLHKELQQMRPFQSPFHISLARDVILDAWHGAQKFARSSAMMDSYSVSQAEYMEKGGDYMKEHCASNRYYIPTAVAKETL
jgi:actin-related protein 5